MEGVYSEEMQWVDDRSNTYYSMIKFYLDLALKAQVYTGVIARGVKMISMGDINKAMTETEERDIKHFHCQTCFR